MLDEEIEEPLDEMDVAEENSQTKNPTGLTSSKYISSGNIANCM